MSFEVERVKSLRKVVDGFTKRERKAYDAAVDELRGRGCRAGGKRLGAEAGGDYPICERPLYAAWRMFTVYPDESRVVIIELDRHTKASAPVEILADVFPGLSPTGRRRSNQPPCCEESSHPPEVSDELRGVLEGLFGL